jgi:hypothetical protein
MVHMYHYSTFKQSRRSELCCDEYGKQCSVPLLIIDCPFGQYVLGGTERTFSLQALNLRSYGWFLQALHARPDENNSQGHQLYWPWITPLCP